MFTAAVLAGNSAEDLFQAFFIIFGLATIFLIMVRSSRVTLENGHISIVIFAISRHAAQISEISSITYLVNFAGFGKVLILQYRWKWGIKRAMRIGIGGYGEKQVKQILNLLLEQNPRIELDPQVREIFQLK